MSTFLREVVRWLKEYLIQKYSLSGFIIKDLFTFDLPSPDLFMFNLPSPDVLIQWLFIFWVITLYTYVNFNCSPEDQIYLMDKYSKQFIRKILGLCFISFSVDLLNMLAKIELNISAKIELITAEVKLIAAFLSGKTILVLLFPLIFCIFFLIRFWARFDLEDREYVLGKMRKILISFLAFFVLPFALIIGITQKAFAAGEEEEFRNELARYDREEGKEDIFEGGEERMWGYKELMEERKWREDNEHLILLQKFSPTVLARYNCDIPNNEALLAKYGAWPRPGPIIPAPFGWVPSPPTLIPADLKLESWRGFNPYKSYPPFGLDVPVPEEVDTRSKAKRFFDYFLDKCVQVKRFFLGRPRHSPELEEFLEKRYTIASRLRRYYSFDYWLERRSARLEKDVEILKWGPTRYAEMEKELKVKWEKMEIQQRALIKERDHPYISPSSERLYKIQQELADLARVPAELEKAQIENAKLRDEVARVRMLNANSELTSFENMNNLKIHLLNNNEPPVETRNFFFRPFVEIRKYSEYELKKLFTAYGYSDASYHSYRKKLFSKIRK